jgi:Zn-dependent protease
MISMLGNFSLSYIIVVIVSLLVSMTVHEFMHAYVGYKLGDTTALEEGRLSFNPLRHIDPVMTLLLPVVTLLLFHAPILAARPVPFNPDRVKYGDYGAAMLAFAGPLANFVLAFIAAFITRFFIPGSFMQQALELFTELNVVLFVFNLIPIPPLDGSRVLYAFAPDALRGIMEQIEPFGIFIIFGLVLLGGFGGFLTNLEQMVLNILP